MFAAQLHIPDYDWNVIMYFDVTPRNTDEVLAALRDIDCPRGIMRECGRQIDGGECNEGFTYSNFKRKTTIISIGRVDSLAEFFNTFSHEQGHLVAHIAECFGISMHSEEAAYLKGDITEMLYYELVDLIKHIIGKVARFVY